MNSLQIIMNDFWKMGTKKGHQKLKLLFEWLRGTENKIWFTAGLRRKYAFGTSLKEPIIR